MKRRTIARTIVIAYDIVTIPFRVIRLFLEWWKDTVGWAIVSYLADWAKKED